MIFFAVTLQIRKIITVNQVTYRQYSIKMTLQLVFGGVCSVIGILMLTVLLQEYHIPFISTQKLFIPCGQPEEKSWSAWADEALDFSAGAQKLWRMLLGRKDSNKKAQRPFDLQILMIRSDLSPSRPLSYPIWHKTEL